MRFSVILVLLIALAFGQDYEAGSLWNKVKGKYGSKEGIQQNADVPLKTDTPMTNVEGTQSFDVRIQCPSRKEGIVITFLPLSGNDYRLIIQEDLDLDGNYEYVYDTGSDKRVSGVCSAGIVSCDAGGTWNNCVYYYWNATSGGYIALEQTDDTSLLGGCFCSNSSCGVNSLVQDIVDFISGGVSQAIMKVRTDLGISSAGFDLSNMSARLYVQNRTQCAYAGTTIYGEQNPTHVYETQMPPDGYSYVMTHPEVQSNPDSPYYLVQKASEVQVEGQSIGYPSRVSCDIRKDAAVYTTDLYDNCSETWVDENGETWCVVKKWMVDKGGPHTVACGDFECEDCGPLKQGSDDWVVCGTVTGSYSYSCSSEPCFTYEQVKSNYSFEWGDYGSWYPIHCSSYSWTWGTCDAYVVGSFVFKLGNLISSEQYQCGTDDWGDPIYCTKNTYELLCRLPLQAQVTLHMAQKWAVRIANEKAGGNKGGYWLYAWRSDDSWGYGSWTGAPYNGTCKTFEFFKVFGTASEEGETHLVGGIQEEHGWGENHTYTSNFGYVYVLKSQTYKGDVVNLSETDTCPTDPGCVIKNEWICDHTGNNCIQTISDGVNTGISPQPMCYQTNTQIGNYIVCAYGDRIEVRGNPDTYNRTYTGQDMWFWIKREYECPPEGVDIDLTRYEKVLTDPGTRYDSSTGTMTVADYSCSGGQCSRQGSYSAELGTPDSCPVATCTVRLSDTDTSVFADKTNKSQTPGGTSTFSLEVRSCQKSGGGWECPVNSGETIVEDCRCDQGLDSTGFSTTVTTLQAVVDASKDVICSTVSP